MLNRFLHKPNPVPAEPDTRTPEERRDAKIIDAERRYVKELFLAKRAYHERVEQAERDLLWEKHQIRQDYEAETREDTKD